VNTYDIYKKVGNKYIKIVYEAEGKVEAEAEGKVEAEAEGKVEAEAEGKVEAEAEGKVEAEAEGEIAARIKPLFSCNCNVEKYNKCIHKYCMAF